MNMDTRIYWRWLLNRLRCLGCGLLRRLAVPEVTLSRELPPTVCKSQRPDAELRFHHISAGESAGLD